VCAETYVDSYPYAGYCCTDTEVTSGTCTGVCLNSDSYEDNSIYGFCLSSSYSSECGGAYGLYYSSSQTDNTTAGSTSVLVNGVCILYFYSTDTDLDQVKFEF